MTGKRATRRQALALAVAAIGAQSSARAEPARSSLTVQTATGRHVFQVEIAVTESEREQGLMHRREMAADAGMLFIFETPRIATFWMKNTYLSLDLIFIRADGSIAHIHADAEPLSLQTIDSREPVTGVLELNAGMAQRIGLKAGDMVRHPAFNSGP